MPILTLSDEQVVELVKQLPPERKLRVLLELAAAAAVERDTRMKEIESSVRDLAAERKRDWDGMTDEERLFSVDDLIHEDRGCA